ncbi:hypothetical protein GW17_00027178 [Ensete ventricosum]|nr:hypothetical protein GW17_00027178 [Ensete ventricosum]RZR85322.1 hypothetical protein BHM03_00012282 [Ensete ventricosum]
MIHPMFSFRVVTKILLPRKVLLTERRIEATLLTRRIRCPQAKNRWRAIPSPRAPDLRTRHIEELLNSTGCLIQLQYLDLASTELLEKNMAPGLRLQCLMADLRQEEVEERGCRHGSKLVQQDAGEISVDLVLVLVQHSDSGFWRGRGALGRGRVQQGWGRRGQGERQGCTRQRTMLTARKEQSNKVE